VIRIDEQTIECVVPHPGAGESFKLPIQDIVKVEHDMRDDDSDWYLRDKGGRRYLLTVNYGNPILDIVEDIAAAQPGDRRGLRAVMIAAQDRWIVLLCRFCRLCGRNLFLI
jgi:hypothetical protein